MMQTKTNNVLTFQKFLFSYGFYILLLCLVILFGFISNDFLTISNWTQISIAACFLLAASAGLTLVLVTGNIDLSIGSIAYLAATVVYLTSDFHPLISVFAALFIGIIFGLFNGFLIAYLKMNSLLTTLGLMIAYRGIALIITGGSMHYISKDLSSYGSVKFFSNK